MMVEEVASPFSIASITAALAAWLLPTSSTLMIRILSVALNPNRSASVEAARPAPAFASVNSNAERTNTINVGLLIVILTLPRAHHPRSNKHRSPARGPLTLHTLAQLLSQTPRRETL